MTDKERYENKANIFLSTITEQQERRICDVVDNYNYLDTLKILSKEFNIPQNAIRIVCRKIRLSGKTRDRRTNKWSTLEIDAINKMIESGHSVLEIASSLKKHPATIRKKIVKMYGSIPAIDIPNEEWHKVYDNYEISDHGRLRRIGKRKLISGRITRDGYIRVSLTTSEGIIDKFIHTLVAEAFIPNPEGKEMIDHRDGNRTNNIVSNLSWVTAEENANNQHRLQAISKRAEKRRIDKEIKEHLKCVFDLGISKLELIRYIVDYIE